MSWRTEAIWAAIGAVPDTSQGVVSALLEARDVTRLDFERPLASPEHSISYPRDSLIDVWIAPAQLDPALTLLPHVLSQHDRNRGECFKVNTQRVRWLATRAMLRLALSAKTRGRVRPADWELEYDTLGRPTVVAGLPQLNLSVSHCEYGSAIAISEDFDLGIDVESLDQPVDSCILTHFASAKERLALQQKSHSDRAPAFLKLWTLKEAYAKLLGLGLAADFSSIEFGFDPIRLIGRDRDAAFRTSAVCLNGHACQVTLALAERNVRASHGTRASWCSNCNATSTEEAA